ncbi:hypothetical protein E2I00_007609, partial [Balaenoptera physalus]
DVLALPIFKQEEPQLSPENEARLPPLQYVLCAATSPAVKLHEETLTYLNQALPNTFYVLPRHLYDVLGPSHLRLEGRAIITPWNEILGDLLSILSQGAKKKTMPTIVTVVTYDVLGTEGSGQSYEIRLLENRKLGDFQDLNTKYVKWLTIALLYIPLSVGILDPRASPTQLNAVEFLWDPSKRASAFIQVHCISTEFTPRKHGGEKGVPFRVQIDTFKQNENGEYTEHLHSASCQIKVFKVGRPAGSTRRHPAPRPAWDGEAETRRPSRERGVPVPKGADRKQKTDREKMEKRTAQEKENNVPVPERRVSVGWCSPWPDVVYQVNSASSPSYNGSPNSFGLGEGNSSPTHPVEALPVGSDVSVRGWALAACPVQTKHPLKACPLCPQHLLPSASMQDAQQWLHRNRSQAAPSTCPGADLLKMSRDDLVQICGPADGIRLFNAIKGRWVSVPAGGTGCGWEAPGVGWQPPRGMYHAIFLEELTTLELIEKIANLGVRMVQNFQDESCFILSTLKAESNDGYHVILKCGL